MVKMLFSDREILPSLYDKQRSANPCAAGGGLLASSSSLLRRRTSREGVQGGEQGGEQGGSRVLPGLGLRQELCTTHGHHKGAAGAHGMTWLFTNGNLICMIQSTRAPKPK